MRPSLLDPLFVPITSLDGVGPKTEALIEKIVTADLSSRSARAGDLLFVLPHSVIDRRNRPGIALAPQGSVVTLDVHVDRHLPPPRGNSAAPYRVYASDATGQVALTFFRPRAAWLEEVLPVGETVVVSGRIEWFNGRPTMVHPDHIARVDASDGLPMIEPVYPLTAGLAAKVVRRLVGQAIDRLPEFPEWLDFSFSEREAWPDFGQALRRIHEPLQPEDVSPDSPAWRRLAYDELLAGQLSLALVRARIRKHAGRRLAGDGSKTRLLLDALPYALTRSQRHALEEISADMARPDRMLRLLQGDVGSGKTVVALLAMAHAIEAGGQAVLMAPTEILARQHFATIAPLAERAGISISVLTGRDKGRDRALILNGLETGHIELVVGTHALFQEAVTFRDLAFVVVDEQHRFGVHQRLALTGKGAAPDMLVMTATPIPRTLVLTAFGDMDVSRLTEKPAGRQPIRTATMPLERLDELVDRVAASVEAGQKVYWICPLVEESEESDLISTEQRHSALSERFGDTVGLIHGRMTGAEKDEAMRAFMSGETRVLVATTVIEVGVDVPDAGIIVIEHAERFGLAQLHQLRGRVGRGSAASACVLLYKAPLGTTAAGRLAVMRATDDGFVIAEEDLRLRGEGEVLGTRQSGMPGFQVAQLERHADLLEIARDDARLILARDPDLTGDRGQALRILLYLFGRDEAVRLLRAG